MKRQQSDIASRVYSYGCVPARVAPVRNEESAIHQLRLGQRLWNTLVAIDRVRMARYRAIMHDDDQERADVLRAEIDGIREAMKGARKKERKRSADLGDMPDRLSALKAERAQIIERLKASRDKRHAERKAQLDANTETAFRRIKRARQAAASMGLFWGSYNDIVQRADSARKLGEMQFSGFRGEGTVTAQIMGGAAAKSCIEGEHTFFQIASKETLRRRLAAEIPEVEQTLSHWNTELQEFEDRVHRGEIPFLRIARERNRLTQTVSLFGRRLKEARKMAERPPIESTRALMHLVGPEPAEDPGARAARKRAVALRSDIERLRREVKRLERVVYSPLALDQREEHLQLAVRERTAASASLADIRAELDRQENLLRVETPPPPPQKWRYARIRIGSNADRSPVWLEIPIVYHRDIPADSQIKSVSATRRIVAGKVRWQLNVTVSMPKIAEKTGDRAIAIDIGWRLMPDGVRVAYWHDGTEGGQVLVPMSHIDQVRKVESLRSICDRSRDESLPMLAAWLSAQSLGEEWQRRSAHLIQWRSSDRLAVLIRWWADNRLTGDEEIFDAARAWRKQYLHLADWWRNLSEQMTLRLREQYRIFASRIAKEYDVVILEDFDLREVAEKPSAESKDVRTAAASYRQIASPSTLRGAVRNACSREGARVEEMPAQGTTSQYWLDGAEIETDQAESVRVTYRGGHSIDQDLNAALSLLSRYRASGEAAKQAGA